MEFEIGQANRLGNRESNQDRFAAFETDEGALLVLADGMGGHAGGELAAQTLIDIARDSYLAGQRPVPDPGRLFTEIVTQAHHAIQRLGEEQGMDSPPGTTGVLCLVQNAHLDWAHVGDSRLYLFRNGLPLFRTTDHSYVEELYQQGMITRAQQDSHPKRGHITQCIGCLPQEPKVELGKGKRLFKDDVVLLCSDGLWAALDDAQMGTLLQESAELPEMVEQMAERAEQSSYPHSDNISVIALRVHSISPKPGKAPPLNPRPEDSPLLHSGDKLQSAIEQIEDVIKKYEGEMDD